MSTLIVGVAFALGALYILGRRLLWPDPPLAAAVQQLQAELHRTSDDNGRVSLANGSYRALSTSMIREVASWEGYRFVTHTKSGLAVFQMDMSQGGGDHVE